MRIGVIGTGNMGGMLAQAFAAADPEATILVHNRTESKASRVARDFNNIRVVASVMEAVNGMDLVFVCTKSADGQALFQEIGPEMGRDQCLITTISSVPLGELEGLTSAHVAKVIPSIVQSVRKGVILVSFGPSMPMSVRDELEHQLSTIGRPFPVNESQIRTCSDLSSCGPAFISQLMMEWSRAAAECGVISSLEAEALLADTLIGLSEMLKGGLSFGDIVSRVAIPGGVTQTGMTVLEQEALSLFQHLHEATRLHGKAKSEIVTSTIMPP